MISLAASCAHPLHWRLTGTSQCLACMPAGFALDDLDAPKPADALGELVAGVTRILETPRTPEDAARQIVQYFVFAYDIKARSDE